MSAADELVSLAKGEVRSDLTSVFSVVRDEMFLLPAFLEHYRRLGIAQFLFLDDASQDGTPEFLAGQPDCVLLRSGLRYGDRVDGRRAVHLWKTEIPRRFLAGQWAICADADELLFLPPGVSSVDELVPVLERRGAGAAAAVMVDFYPETVERMEALGAPASLEELLASYPWFDAGPYFRWPSRRMPPPVLHGGVRDRLLRQYDISRRGRSGGRLKRLRYKVRSGLLGKQYVRTIHKVPLVKWDAERFYADSHTLNEAPDPGILLPLAHFKFTSALHEKVQAAVSSRAYNDASRAYWELADLLAAMKAGDGSFLGPRSVRFTGVEDFERAGLLMFEPGR